MFKKLIQGLAVSFFGIFLSLLIIEAAFRLIANYKPSAPKWSDRPKFYFKDESAETIQDYAYSKKKPSGRFRIAVVGDSFTFAPYMQFTDAFPKKLEQMLNLNDVKLRAEVINYGVPAYSTTHEVPVVRKAIEEGADLVLLQITLNDPELKPYTPQEINLNLDDPFAPLVFEGRMAKLANYWRTLAFVLTRLHNEKTHKAYRDYFFDLFENKRTWNAFQKAFKRIQELCQDADVPFAAVIFPLFGLPLDDSYPFHPIHEKLAAFLTDNKVDFLDISSSYAGIPLERLQVMPGLDRHPNEIGHRIAAEEIYYWLDLEGLIPEELKIRRVYSERIGITGKGLINLTKEASGQGEKTSR